MKITTEILKDNFEPKEYEEIRFLVDKYEKTLNFYKKNNPELYNEYLELMSEDEKNLMENGILSDKLIKYNLNNKTNLDRGFTKPDGTFCPDLFQSTFKIMLLKVVTEISSLVDLNRYDCFKIEKNEKATNIVNEKSKPSSDPDFTLTFKDNDNKKYYLELKAYMNKDVSDRLYFKTWQYDKLCRYLQRGKKVIILHKYYLGDKVLYRFYNFEKSLNELWHEQDTPFKNSSELYYHQYYVNVKPDLEFYQSLNSCALIPKKGIFDLMYSRINKN